MADPAVLIAAISVIGSLGLAILGIFGAIINGKLNAAKDARAADAELRKQEAAKSEKKLEEIHVQTNSNLASLNTRLDKALATIEQQQRRLDEMHKPAGASPAAAPPAGQPAGATAELKVSVPKQVLKAEVKGE